MKLKNILLSGLSLVLVAALAIGGTIAYLTDTDSDVNVMTLGNVSIRQNEQQRVEKDGVFTSELENFKQGKALLPYTTRDGGIDTLTVGEHTFERGDSYNNYIDKIVSVTNTGKTDAFVRTLIAIPTGGDDWEPDPVAASDVWLHWNVIQPFLEHWHSSYTDPEAYKSVLVEIGGKGYYVWEFTHKNALKPEETSFPTLMGCFMDNRVDHDEDGYYMDMNSNGAWDNSERRIEDLEIGATTEILVLSQAVQTAGFADPQTALDTAFGDVTTAKAAEWFGGVVIPTVVSTADELKDALAAGGNVVLAEDLTVDAPMEIPSGVTVNIDLNGNTLTGAPYTTSSGTASLNNVFNNSGELTITGSGEIRTRNIINNPGAKLVIDGDIKIIGGAEGGGSAIWNEGDCVIKNVTIEQTNTSNYAIKNAVAGATLTVDNAKVISKHGAIANDYGTTIINGGYYEVTGASSDHVVYAPNGAVTINGGTFKLSQADAASYGSDIITGDGTVVINGGTFDAVAGALAYNDNASLVINGGTFLNKATTVYSGDFAQFVAATSTAKTNADGSVTVTKN